MTRGDTLRRVSVVGRLDDSPREPMSPPIDENLRGDVTRDRLVRALEELAEHLRCGQLVSDGEDAVLLDAVVHGIHCVMVEYSPPLLVALSPREKQVALMVARGRTNQAIANTLEISVWTVATHLRRVFAKLAVSSRAEMVAHLLDSTEFASQLNRPTSL